MEIVENKINPANVADENVKKAPRYDPSKKYRWEPGSNFLLSGEEFGLVLNSLRAILNTPEAQKILLADKANQCIDRALARAVEVGIVKEDTAVVK